MDDMEMKYKKPLQIKEQIEYLKKTKRIVFNEISEDDAAQILYKNKYINVITPYKYRFAKKNNKGQEVRDKNGKHIYERDVEFKEYYDLYLKERTQFPVIYQNIVEFEKLMNAIVSYEVLIAYDLESDDKFYAFIETLKGNVCSSQFPQTTKVHMLETFDSLNEDIMDYSSPYITLDRISFGTTLAILVNLDKKLKIKCINEIINRQDIIKANDPQSFYQAVAKLIKIRNCVCHNNSIEILLRYLSVKHKRLRTSSDKKSYAYLLIKLQKTKKDSN